MSKYFVRYAYNSTEKIRSGNTLDLEYETKRVEDSCVLDMDDERVNISNIQDYILDEELGYMGNHKLSSYEIDIIGLNKL